MDDDFITEAPDPNQCTVEICTSTFEADTLKELYSPLLDGIDPAFQLIRFNTRNPSKFQSLIEDTSSTRRNDSADITSDGLLPAPSLALMLFLREKGPITAENCQECLRQPTWKFHHKIELGNIRKGGIRSVAKQEYYQPSSVTSSPLWSVCPVHFGNEHLRFTVFTRNFPSMVEFYRQLTMKEVDYTKPNFCVFELYSQPGLDIQLALKQALQLQPTPLTTTFLRFKIKTLKSLEILLTTPPKNLSQTSDHLFMIQDPDGNNIIIETVEPYDLSWHGVLPPQSCESQSRQSQVVHKSQSMYCQTTKNSQKTCGSEHSSFDSGQHSSSFNSDSWDQSDTETYYSSDTVTSDSLRSPTKHLRFSQRQQSSHMICSAIRDVSELTLGDIRKDELCLGDDKEDECNNSSWRSSIYDYLNRTASSLTAESSDGSIVGSRPEKSSRSQHMPLSRSREYSSTRSDLLPLSRSQKNLSLPFPRSRQTASSRSHLWHASRTELNVSSDDSSSTYDYRTDLDDLCQTDDSFYTSNTEHEETEWGHTSSGVCWDQRRNVCDRTSSGAMKDGYPSGDMRQLNETTSFSKEQHCKDRVKRALDKDRVRRHLDFGGLSPVNRMHIPVTTYVKSTSF